MLDSEKPVLKPESSHAADAFLRGPLGLRGSSATAFSAVAKGFASEVLVRWDGRQTDGKSASDLARLGIEAGQVIRIITRGPDAEAALTALEQAVMDGLEADADPFEADVIESLEQASDIRRGSPSSPGIAIASAFVWSLPEVAVSSLSEGYHKERNKFLSALIAARQELQKLVGETAQISGSLLAPLFAEQLGQLESPELLEDTDAEIRRGFSALEAFANVVQQHEVSHEIEERVMNILAGQGAQQRARLLPPNPVILVCSRLSPSDYSTLDAERIAGVVLENDIGRSVGVKLLKSRGIPCVSRLGPQLSPIRSGVPLIVDGEAGLVVVKPEAQSYRIARSLIQTRMEKKERMRIEAERPQRTESIPAFSHSVEHFAQAAKIAASLDIPTLELKDDVRRAGASRELSDEIAIDKPEPTSPSPRKRGLWDQIFGRK